MQPVPPEAQLYPKLEELLKNIPDRPFAQRLRVVYLRALEAISHLSDLDLLRYEVDDLPEGPDLSVWESMAPVIGDTFTAVNGLFGVVREQFPAAAAGGLGELLAQSLAEAEAPATARAEEVLRRQAGLISRELTRFGQSVRDPSVVSDRWNLLTEVQGSRSRLREYAAGLVFHSAVAFGSIRRQEVIPGHQEEVAGAIVVRKAFVDLARTLEPLLAPGEPRVGALLKALDEFGRAEAYPRLRAQDKRALLELRTALAGKPVRDRTVSPAEAVSQLTAWVQSLREINRRELLLVHDREVADRCAVKLERSRSQRAADPAQAAFLLAGAIAGAQALYGRDAELDDYLRAVDPTRVATLRGEALKAELTRVAEHLVRVALAVGT